MSSAYQIKTFRDRDDWIKLLFRVKASELSGPAKIVATRIALHLNIETGRRERHPVLKNLWGSHQKGARHDAPPAEGAPQARGSMPSSGVAETYGDRQGVSAHPQQPLPHPRALLSQPKVRASRRWTTRPDTIASVWSRSG